MPRRLLFLVAGLVAVTSCTRSSSAAFTTQTVPTTLPPSSTSTSVLVLAVPPPAPITITGAGFDLHTAGRVPTAAFDAAWAGVLDTLNRYLEVAVVNPLRSGGPAGDLAPYFSGPAAAKVTVVGPDRGAFIEESLPPLSDLREETGVAQLTGLAGADGVMSVITANLDLRLIGHVAGSPVTVVRTGELVLMPEGGRWRIDAYDLKVVRSQAEDTTTTTVRS
ncbi:MAG TPA: hypothetical protein VJ653_03425 [Acidimicrobiales bacterium]|nr:hypothetical protein [Acidimicrobiales bacterium]